MFSKFTEEREVSPDQPEINFFAECIIDKLNRSKMTTKSGTPFLDDTRRVPFPNSALISAIALISRILSFL
jgi:hypothetical protein